MIEVLDIRGRRGDAGSLVPRAAVDVDAASEAARQLIEEVRVGREVAVLAIGERFDGVRPASLRVPVEIMDRALEQLDPEVLASLKVAIDRVTITHRDQLPDVVRTTVAPGATVTSSWLPVDRVGLYVPGGRAVYPSSVVMNVVPAQLAGVESIAIVSPPQVDFDGWPHPTVMAAARLLGIEEMYAAGGAQAVAWLAFGSGATDDGTVSCPSVSMITGPGNIYVTAAKRLLAGTVGIDSEAGPTEIMILADETADPRFVAADLISQAEHDVLAAAVLVTPSSQLIEAVKDELAVQVPAAKHGERIAESLAGPQSALVLVDDLEQGLEVVNKYGAEHLEIQTAQPAAVAGRVRNAGAIFLGSWTPVSLGDYCAGSNHVLPTGGCACFSSGLSVHSFLRHVQIVDYQREALESVATDVVTLSRAEDLPAHGRAVSIRMEVGNRTASP